MISIGKRKDNEEIVLSFDKEGGKYLIKQIESMLEGKIDSHEHLYTKEWAGTELSSEINFQDSTISNMFTLYFLANDKGSHEASIKSQPKKRLKMKNKLLYIILTFVCLLSTACSSPYIRDTYEYRKEFSNIQKGIDTKEDIRQTFGEPDKINNSNGDEWVYWCQQLSSYNFPFYRYYSGTKVADSYYGVFFDSNNIVSKSISSSVGYHETRPKAQKRP
jgi:outer membrane protein assembly factor BamE (lipoprotein component of BamABCDE complex)